MLKSSIKKTFAVIVLLAILVPYFTNVVLAVESLTPTTESATFRTSDMREGEDEETGTLPADLRDDYDANSYQYKVKDGTSVGGTDIGGVITHKIIQAENPVNFNDSIYCLNAELQFPSAGNMVFRNKGDFYNTSIAEVNAYKNSIGEANYNAIVWITKNAYLRHINPNYKDQLLAEVFKDEIADTTTVPPTTVNLIKSILTDDDIDVIQQWAIWHFSNDDRTQGTGGHTLEHYYKTFGNMYVTGISYTDKSVESIHQGRQTYANKLYTWFVNNATNNTDFGFNITYPKIAKQSSDLTVTVENGMHKVGPFKVTSGTADASQYTLKLTNGTSDLIRSEYQIKIDGESTFTNKNVNEIFDKDYYIYLPLNSNITHLKLVLAYTKTETKANLWNPDDATYQNTVVINREEIPVEEEIHVDVREEKVDLALKKFITKVNGTDVTPTREPVVDVAPLKEGKTDAGYTLKEDSVTVKKGDIVTYKIRVYNEGDIAAYASKVADYIPNGLGLISNYKGNSSWTPNSDSTKVYGKLSEIEGAVASAEAAGITTADLTGVTSIGDMTVYTAKDKYGLVISNALNKANAERALNPFNKTTGTALDSMDIEVTCVVLGGNNTILKNIAEINENTDEQGNPISDKDSTPGTVNPENYPDGEKRPDGTTYQDDNDKEILTLDELREDLALRKYIIKVNDKEVKRSNNEDKNAPKVDATGLISGDETAIYKGEKQPYEVSKGDTVVFEIRVYNEGDVAGIANEIVDYLPEGLTLTPNSTINTKYKWEPLSGKDNAYISNYLSLQLLEGKKLQIPAFDKANNKMTAVAIQIECTVTGDFASGKVLTNVAEIYSDDLTDDADSDPKSIVPENIDTENYTGDKNNKSELNDKEYFYKGLQDDDDFEKLVIRGGIFDLSLKKFITKINGTELTGNKSREPEVDVTPLKEGKKDAKYTTVKSTVAVKKGDVIIYTLRVYNEGTKAGYAEVVSDYLPEGLGFLVDHKVNFDNKWDVTGSNGKTIDLTSIEGYSTNLSKDDFEGKSSLSDVKVITGKNIKITSTKLKSDTVGDKNLLKPFDRTSGTELDYKDIQIACIVLSDKVENNNFRNIAEIEKESDENKVEVPEEPDSTPGTVNPEDYPDGEKRPDGTQQDDNDFENVLPIVPENIIDLALQKFITKLNDKAITDRTPTITKNQDGTLRYNHSTSPLDVANGDTIVYTIRVYNEGDKDGYAGEVGDDVPAGLEFIPNDEINKKYEWVMYDKNGKETTDVTQAATVKTKYLSKESGDKRKEDTLIKALDKNKTTSDGTPIPYYKDVQIAFKVVEKDLGKDSKRIVKNIAEITEYRDDKNNILDQDLDSRPDNHDEKEDDLDSEVIKIKYFDLSLKKNLVKIIITENGKTREISASNENELLKVEVNRKRINSTTIKFVYDIIVKNEGEIEGYAKEISDYIPDGLKFNQTDNKIWTQKGDKLIVTDALADTLLKPGQSAKVQVTLQWINSGDNMGTLTNVAEISKDENPNGSKDIDSTPGNKVATEDDLDDAPVILSISTGSEQRYIVLPTVVIAIMITGIVLIKKYVL